MIVFAFGMAIVLSVVVIGVVLQYTWVMFIGSSLFMLWIMWSHYCLEVTLNDRKKIIQWAFRPGYKQNMEEWMERKQIMESISFDRHNNLRMLGINPMRMYKGYDPDGIDVMVVKI